MQPRLSPAPRQPHLQRRILVPLGLAALGETKLPVARDCARAFGADVVLLHVSPASARRAEAQSSEAAARAYLDTVVAHLHAAGVRAEAAVRPGPVAATIVREARERGADLIVLGASLRPALLRAVLGSVADAVVDSAPCPVLLVRPAREAGVGSPLQSFAAAAARVGALTRHLPRQQTVEVARIIGSVGRVHELAADFRPPRRARRPLDEQRLARIRRAMGRGERLPAVELYQLGSGYYVLDGHHRVAAARLLGQLALDATVVEFVPRAGMARTPPAPDEREQPSGGDTAGAARPAAGPAPAQRAPASRQRAAGLPDAWPWRLTRRRPGRVRPASAPEPSSPSGRLGRIGTRPALTPSISAHCRRPQPSGCPRVRRTS
jgi:nucleotide-binding universal stress UspA family protein